MPTPLQNRINKAVGFQGKKAQASSAKAGKKATNRLKTKLGIRNG